MTSKAFSLSTKVVIRDECGRCLLLRRSSQSTGNPGRWEFPGGKVEAGEDFDIALCREVAEETGLEIDLERVIGATEFELPARKVAYLILEGRLRSGQVQLSSEHQDHTWVLPAELPEFDLVEQFIPFVAGYSHVA